MSENIPEGVKIPEWIRPDLQNEAGELERVVRDFLGREPNAQNIAQILGFLENSPIVELSDADWELLENTDSFHQVVPGQIETARNINQKYNEKLAAENKRDFESLLGSFFQGNKIECPTILKNKEGKLHLISGNTRLMIARALKIRPRVIIGEIV